MAKLSLTATEIAQLAADAGFQTWQVVRMTSICLAESAGNAYAVNVVHNPTSPAHRSLDIGLWQINTHWWPGSILERLDPAGNARMAWEVFEAHDGPRSPVNGYNAWTTYRNMSYLVHQPAAITAARAIGVWP
jgi:hypothetical protein